MVIARLFIALKSHMQPHRRRDKTVNITNESDELLTNPFSAYETLKTKPSHD